MNNHSYCWIPSCGCYPEGIRLSNHITHWYCPKCQDSQDVRLKGKIFDPWGKYLEYEAKCACRAGFTFSDDGEKITAAFCTFCLTAYELRYEFVNLNKPVMKSDGKCTCSLGDLMSVGCQCGSFKAEKKT